MKEAVVKLDPQRLLEVFYLICNVEEGNIRVLHSSVGKRVMIRDGEDLIELEFTDNPLVRMVDTVRQVFPSFKETWSAILRLQRLFELAELNQLGPFAIRSVTGDVRIHESAVLAAAQVDCTEEVSFEAIDIQEAAEQFAEQYA